MAGRLCERSVAWRAAGAPGTPTHTVGPSWGSESPPRWDGRSQTASHVLPAPLQPSLSGFWDPAGFEEASRRPGLSGGLPRLRSWLGLRREPGELPASARAPWTCSGGGEQSGRVACFSPHQDPGGLGGGGALRQRPLEPLIKRDLRRVAIIFHMCSLHFHQKGLFLRV